MVFCEPPEFNCVSFCTPPSFECISFCTPPSISVIWGIPPVVSCIVQVVCGASSTPDVDPPMGMAAMDYDNTYSMNSDVALNSNDLGIPEEFRLIVPKISDIKLVHNVPREIFIRGDIPQSISMTHILDATNVPRTIFLEPASNFPSVLKMEIIGMPKTLQVTGIPDTIEVIDNIPRTIQLVMPENPVVEMRCAPLELKPSPDLEKLLSNLVITPK